MGCLHCEVAVSDVRRPWRLTGMRGEFRKGEWCRLARWHQGRRKRGLEHSIGVHQLEGVRSDGGAKEAIHISLTVELRDPYLTRLLQY